jgi:hypothetical protein
VRRGISRDTLAQLCLYSPLSICLYAGCSWHRYNEGGRDGEPRRGACRNRLHFAGWSGEKQERIWVTCQSIHLSPHWISQSKAETTRASAECSGCHASAVARPQPIIPSPCLGGAASVHFSAAAASWNTRPVINQASDKEKALCTLGSTPRATSSKHEYTPQDYRTLLAFSQG